MKKQFTNKARYLGLKLTAIVFALLLISGQSWGQTVFTDDFSTNTNATYTTSGAIGASAWSVTRSGVDWGGRRNTSPAQLELTNDASATANVAGWVFGSTSTSSFSSPYNTTLSSNTGLVTWTFNMRQPRTDPAGFGSGAYGVAFILGGTSTSLNNTGTGYAVVLGQSGTTDPVRLARYNNGLQGTVTNIITSNTTGLTDFGTEYLSIKVTYNPSNNQWELFLRNDGASAFADPASGSLTTQGTATDNTYTGTSLTDLGGYWQGSTGANLAAFFDNVTVSLTSSGNTAPTVTSSAATAIETTTATLNGNVTSDGGATITERGFVYKTTAGVTISDNKTTVSGTTGAYTLSPTLSAGQQYFFKAYAINSVGTTLSSPELSFYTLSNEPSLHATTFTATANSQTQIDLAFDAASTITDAAGYLILQRSGAAPTGLPADATAYTVGNTIGDGTVAAIITNTADVSKSITGLTAGTQYYFTLFPYNWDGTNATTYNYKTDLTIPTANAITVAPLDATSEVSGPALGSQPNPTLISSLVTTDGAAVRVFDMDIYDYGTDGQPTKITLVTIKAGTNNTADWANTIQGVKLSTDAGATFVTIGTPTIAASSIIIPIISGNLNITDADASTVSLFVYLKSSGLTDNDVLEFKVDATAAAHGFIADATGSTLLTTFASAPVSNQILVDVEATKLAFVQQPTNASPNVAMTPAVTVKATDVNNNIDLDYVTDINITSSGTLTGSPVAVTPASGIATFSTLTHTALGNNFTLNAASGTLSNAISNNFSISSLLLVEDFDYTNGALLTANGWSAHSTGGSQAIDVVVPGLTFNGYVGSGVGGAAKVDNTGEDLNKTFTPKTSGSIYAAFIISASATNNAGYFFHLAQDNILNTTYVSRVWINATGTSVGIGTSATVAISANTPTLLVVKYNIDTKLSSLYVLNSMSATEPSTADATFTETATLTNVGAVCLRQYNASQNILVDGIRVTTSWSDLAIAFSGTGEWSNSSLWNTGAVPAANESVLINGDASITGNVEVAGLTINSGKSLTVNVGKQLTVTGATTLNGTECLVLKSDVNGTASFINNGTISGSGTAKVERYITNDNKWHFLSSPVAAQLIKPNFAPNTCDETFDFYKWDASADLTAPTSTPWVNLRATATTYEQTFETNFAVGRGYLVAYSSSYGGSETHQFTGTLNSGDKSIGVVYDVNNKFNLIGNPFPSAINWGNVTKTDLASQYAWIYNENISDYTEISTGTIAPMQGFFVEVNPAVTTFTIPNSVRTHDASTFLKTTTANTNEVSLKFSNDTKWGTTRIQFLANATTGKDWYDALKLFSMNTAIPQVYTTISTGQKFAVNALPELNANTTVPVSIYVPANGNFSITTDGLANLSNCTSVILEDLKTNTTQNLMQNPVYNFTATTTDNANRFVLHFATSVGVNEIGKTNGGIYAYDNNIYVNTNEQIKQISVYNAMGQLIKTVNNVNGLQKINMNGHATGYYIVKVISDKNVYSEKVLIK